MTTFGDYHPETQRQLERLFDKAHNPKKPGFGSAPAWSVLIPKTRPYLRKFGLRGPSDNARHTADLLTLEPTDWLISKYLKTTDSKGTASSLGKQHSGPCDRERDKAACLLWLLCVHGPFGDLFDCISRWGKEYPTLHDEDVISAQIPESDITTWVQNHDAVACATSLSEVAAIATDWQHLIHPVDTTTRQLDRTATTA